MNRVVSEIRTPRFSRESWIIGLFSVLYSGYGMWRPSFWTDEAATLSAVRRPLSDLHALLGNVDAVHGAYYYLMFGWTRLFGFSELALRLPSVIAVSCAAILTVELGRKIAGTSFGVVAAVLLIVMPRTQYAGTDARSYALTLLGAVAATYLLVSVRNRPRVATWVAYSLVGALTVSLSFYCVLLFGAHAITVLLDSRLRAQYRSMIGSSIGWIIPALVLASVGSRQQFQISWIRDVGPAFPYEFIFLQFFADGYFATDGRVVPTPTSGEDTSMVVLAFIMWAAAVTGVVLCRRHFIVLLALPWLVFPAVAVIGGSLITGGDYYLPRYLTFVLPAMALLSAALVLRLRAVGIAARNQRAAVGVATLVVVALCLPSYVGQRTQYGRDRQDDFRFVAESVAKLATPGDSFVISPDRDLVYQAYPEAYKGLGDPTLGITASQWKRVFNQRFDVQAVKDEIRRYHTVILIENLNELTMAAALSDMGYTKGESYEGPSSRVTKYYSK